MDMLRAIIEIGTDPKFLLGLALGIGYSLCKLARNKDVTYAETPKDLKSEENVVFTNSNDDMKLVLVVRTDLNMGKGKIAAQCSHAAVAAYKAARKHTKILRAWEDYGQTKITLKIDSEAGLLELSKHAKALGLLANVVQDAGRTQIASGSRTVCGIGPGPAKLIDQVTGHLKLF